METPLSLATESFSYSWLTNSKPSLDNLLPEPPRRLPGLSSYQNFNFDVSNLQAPSPIAHADELFSDGLIRPVFVDTLKGECSHNTRDSTETTKSSYSVSSIIVSARPVGVHSLGLPGKHRSTKKRFIDYVRLLSRLCCILGWSRKSTKVGNVDKPEWEGTSKPIGTYRDNENSIYEAVLHCKRSIGMNNYAFKCFFFHLLIVSGDHEVHVLFAYILISRALIHPLKMGRVPYGRKRRRSISIKLTFASSSLLNVS